MPFNAISTSHNYTSFDVLKNSLKDLTGNEGKLKLSDGKIEVDTRSKHFFSIGSWKRENQAIYQSTRELGEALKQAMQDKFGEKTGISLFNRYIKTKADGSQSILARDVKALFEDARIQEIKLKAAMLDLKPGQSVPDEMLSVFKGCHVPLQLANHILSRGQIALEPTSHDFQSLINKKKDLEFSKQELTSLRNQLAKGNLAPNLQSTRQQMLETLDGHLKDFEALLKNVNQELEAHPLKKENIIAGADEIFNACQKVLDDLKKQHLDSPKKMTQFQSCADFLNTSKQIG
ncbi:MAG: hypothetical protein IJU40_07255, partial [Desulfovibrionaceae bacterium]|nr:hypothetical protein [Desulfovibrionaceae bacterium]